MNDTIQVPAQRRLPAAVAAALCTLAFSGCAIMPMPATEQDIAKRVVEDRQKMFADQEALKGPVSFPEAAARAVKYNLDNRLKLMESALAQGQLDLSHWDMFPRMLVNAGYVSRSNELAYVNSAGVPSSTTLERNRRIASAELSWNILDFGTSYYRAKMAADQTLVAEERKRKVLQNLMQDTRNAYWRALGAQRLVGKVDELMVRTKTALARARQIEQQGLLPQAQALAYQRALLDAVVLLQSRRQDLELAKAELAALMNVPPGTSFTLAETAEDTLPAAPTNITQLEELALAQRPELREEDYKRRITGNDTRRAITTALPGLSFDLSQQYDSNKFLVNNSWTEGGLRLSMSLFRLASIPTIKRAGEAQATVDDTRRMAQAMAVLTQVRVASLRYGLSRDELDAVNDSANVDQRLANFAKASATSRVDSELEVIRTEARAVLSQYQRSIAYSNAQAAWGRLYNSIGLDVAAVDPQADIPTLAKSIESSLAAWQKVTFDSAAKPKAELPPVRLVVEGLADPALRAAVAEGMGTALKRYDVDVVDRDGGWSVVVHVDTESPVNGTRRANWRMTLMRPNATSAGSVGYSSVLPHDLSATALNALSQSAIDSHATAVTDWLEDGMSNVAQANR